MIILIIIFLICNAYHHQGAIQINQTLSLKTNFTQLVQSIIIKFILPLDRNRNQTVTCFVSNFDLESQILDIQDLKLNNQNYIVYDLHSIQSNSNTQLIEYYFFNTIYLLCQSQTITQIEYQLFYKEDSYKTGCINDCQGYNNTEFISKSYCQNNHCECQINQIGFFCQLSLTQILSNTPKDVILDSFQWKFFYYQYNNMDLVLLCNLPVEDKSVLYSMTFRQIPQLEIPNLSNSQILINGTSLQIELSKLIKYQNESKILYIGLYNNNSQQTQFKITIVSNELLDYGQLERNEIIIIVVGTVIGILLLITCIFGYLKTKKLKAQQQSLRIRGMRIEQQHNQVQVEVSKESIGFTQQFIKNHFGVISYKKLIQQYPGLRQFEDCIICLESIKNGSKKQLRYCSVTPCFHIFHQKCLTSWLLKQQNCPFCREEFTIRLIQNKYPWLDLKQQRVNNSTQYESKYIKNMKFSSNTDQSQDNQLNESQQELVRKDKIIIEI